MICLKRVKKFCKDYTKIENYEEAVNDNTKMWDCHHILGEILSREQLKDHDFYYDVPPCMLKFITRAEHTHLHKKGMHRSDETKKKISKAHKGLTFSEEHRRKLSEAKKGKHRSEETCRKISESMKGRSSWNKGIHHSDDTRKKISDALKRRNTNTLQGTV